MGLEGKVAIVTGGASGIGKATCLRLARDGAKVVVADLSAEAARATAEEIRALGRSALEVRVNVADVSQLQAMVDATVEKYGRIDILVASAGIVQIKRFLEISEAEWDRVLAVNAKGLFFTVQLVARQMVRQGGGGSIANISSISAQGPRPLQPHYAASKAAVISITRSAAAALAPYGITVNAVAPGIVETPMWEQIDRESVDALGQSPGEYRASRKSMIPLGRLQTPEDVADAVAFLVSEGARNITGQTLNVDGGFYMH